MHPKPLLFFIGVGVFVAWIFFSGTGSSAPVRAGSRAPTFTVKNLEGEEVSLNDLKGRVVFLSFWRTDCSPCAAEMPNLEFLAKTFSGRKFAMMPVSLDLDSGNVSRFYSERYLTMPAFLDPHQSVADRYNITGTPETFVIDSEGNVAKYYLGPQSWTSPRMVAMLDGMIPE
jgi:peroxiredoxin